MYCLLFEVQTVVTRMRIVVSSNLGKTNSASLLEPIAWLYSIKFHVLEFTGSNHIISVSQSSRKRTSVVQVVINSVRGVIKSDKTAAFSGLLRCAPNISHVSIIQITQQTKRTTLPLFGQNVSTFTVPFHETVIASCKLIENHLCVSIGPTVVQVLSPRIFEKQRAVFFFDVFPFFNTHSYCRCLINMKDVADV